VKVGSGSGSSFDAGSSEADEQLVAVGAGARWVLVRW
jgi:hypothetical protein